MNKEKFEKEFKERQQEAEKILTGYLPDREGLQKTIFDAMEYSLMAGGKRIRPILMREAYRLFGGEDMKVIEPFMAAIEMVHTYSLVHDDLPAMDNDDYRRGRKTTHVVYGEDMGILAGDALLNYAFETASQCFDHISDPMSAAKAMQIFARKAGVYGMVGGQVVDVHPNAPKDIAVIAQDRVLRTQTGQSRRVGDDVDYIPLGGVLGQTVLVDAAVPPSASARAASAVVLTS